MSKVNLRKSGSSLVFTVPTAIADQLGAGEGSEFDMILDVRKKTIRFEKVQS